ncbi:hypothetical protein FPHYL_11171 [Fusarium phyllophilum]|uniref:Uncharacterized protein n=1 Tax=Fusarium phyllophilum TaxID=47803 RepID=A0A8H5MWJ2_9HYPO|nr:hypothetical protein FPHYL_11171 [Fusarium phyllophilum]
MKYYQPIDPEDQESDADDIFEEYLERFCLNVEYRIDIFKAACKEARDELRCKFKELRESMRSRIKRQR